MCDRDEPLFRALGADAGQFRDGHREVGRQPSTPANPAPPIRRRTAGALVSPTKQGQVRMVVEMPRFMRYFAHVSYPVTG